MNNIIFEQKFKGGVNVLGNKLEYINTESPELERWQVILPPESYGEWHIHLVPEFFYIESGTLYVVNELTNQKYIVNTFSESEHGLTDCNVPQFIWNPDKQASVRVTAIYIGCARIKPTKSLGKKPSQELLDQLLNEPIICNATEKFNTVTFK